MKYLKPRKEKVEAIKKARKLKEQARLLKLSRKGKVGRPRVFANDQERKWDWYQKNKNKKWFRDKRRKQARDWWRRHRAKKSIGRLGL